MQRKIIAVGHRGVRDLTGVPENTLAAHNEAFRRGARGVEFDIQQLESGEFVLFHDVTLNRKSTGKGKLVNKSASDLRDIKLKHKGQVTDFKIPTLESALANVGGRYMVDLDYKDGQDDAADRLESTLKNAGFDAPNAPLVTIFCRSKKDYLRLAPLNKIYSVRPLFDGKDHPAQMVAKGFRVMGLRQYQHKKSYADAISDQNFHIFANAMKVQRTRAAINHIADILGFKIRWRYSKTTPRERHNIFTKAISYGPLFLQTDYLGEVVPLLRSLNLYEDRVLNRAFQPM